MEFPLAYLLLPYLLFVLIALLFFFFNIYHIAKFGLQSTHTAFVLGLYLLGFFAIAIVSLILFTPYDWMSTLGLSDIFRVNPSSLL